MRQFPIFLLIAFSIICMSSSSVWVRYSSAPAMIIALYRVIFTSVMAGLLCTPKVFDNKKLLSKKDFLSICGAGVFLALHFAFWISSLDYTTVSSSVLFTNLQVIFVVLFSILFLKEKVQLWTGGGIVIALCGSALIAHGDLLGGKFLGDMLALLSGFFVAVYFIIGRQVRARVDVWPYTAIVSAVAAVVLFIASSVMGLELTRYPRIEWIYFILLALGPGIAGHGILNWALKYLQAPIVAVSILGESVGASILAWILFDEVLQWYQILGGILILTGIYVSTKNQRDGSAGCTIHERVVG